MKLKLAFRIGVHTAAVFISKRLHRDLQSPICNVFSLDYCPLPTMVEKLDEIYYFLTIVKQLPANAILIE